MRKKASYEEISIECAKHALEFLHYIATFRNLNPSELYEVRKFIHIMSGYNRALKKYKEKSENQQLKELLEEAKDIIEWYKGDCGYKDIPTETVLTKIDNAIGEK